MMTTVAWCRNRSRMLTAVVCSGRKRPHSSPLANRLALINADLDALRNDFLKVTDQ